MTTARDIMTPEAQCVSESDSIQTAARRMAELNIGSLPICGEDDRLKGMITDRDIVVKVIAEGKDPASCTVADFAQGKPVTIGADDDAAEILHMMSAHQVRRLPVIDGHDLVGIVALSDVAKALPDKPVGEVLEAISA